MNRNHTKISFRTIFDKGFFHLSITLFMITCLLLCSGLIGCTKVEMGETSSGTSGTTPTTTTPTAIAVSVSDPNIMIGTYYMVTALLTDVDGNPVGSGFSVNFSIDPPTAGVVSPTSNMTSSTGQATVVLNPQAPVPAMILAQYSGLSDFEFITITGDPNAAADPNSTPSVPPPTIVTPGPPSSIVLSAESTKIVADGKSDTTITAMVTDNLYHPVADGTIVYFSITAGTGMISAYGTTTEGIATATLTSSTTGNTTVTVSATAGTVTQTLNVRYIPGEPTNITLVASAATLPPDGSSQSTITATLTDDYGNTISEPNLSVSFTTSLGDIPATVKTDINGQAVATLTAGKISGTAKVVAVSGTAYGQTNVTISNVVVSEVSLSADPARIQADGKSQSIITAQVMDASNNPVPDNTPVSFTLLGGVPNLGIIDGAALTQNGIASAVLTSSTTVQTVTVQAAAGAAAPVTITIDYLPGEPTNITLVPSTATLPPDGSSQSIITATLTDEFGNPISEPNLSVSFTSSLGTITPTVKTDTSGQAVAILTAGKISGTAKVVAVLGTAYGQTNITISNVAVDKVNLSANPARIVADGQTQSTITAQVMDASNNPVPDDTPVSFTIVGGGADSGIIDAAALTKNGIATAVLTSGTTVQTVTVQAAAGAAAPVTINVTYIPGEPANIALVPSPATLPPDGSSQSTITATLTDDFGNTISEPNLSVAFTTTLGEITSPITTDTSGQAIASLTAGTISGTAKIVATIGDAYGQTNVTISSVVIDKINLTAQPSSLNADGSSTATIRAQVMDPNNNPVPDNTPVSFLIIGGSANSGIVQGHALTTGGFGQVTYTSGTQPQTVTIQGSSGGKAATVNIILQSETLETAAISISASTTTLQVGESATAAITATAQTSVGSPISGAIVEFETDFGGITPLDTTDPNGVATATFTAGTVAGAATITATMGIVSDSIVITLTPGPASNIVLDEEVTPNPDPSQIYIKGTNKNQTSTFTFIVRDKNGNCVADGQAVKFVLLNNGLGGGETLKPGAGTDPNVADWALTVGGKVKTTLESGFKAGTVKIIAFIDDNNNGEPEETEVQSAATGIAINGGLPDGENFGVHPDILNIAGLIKVGLTDTITAMLADRYHNNVPPDTAVYFTTDYASITGQGINHVEPDAGASYATAILTTMNPPPPDGFVRITASTDTGNWGRVLCLAKHPTNPNIIYVGTDGGGIFKTTDAQSTPIHWIWVGRPENGLANGIVRDIQIDESQPSIIYAATDDGVFRSIGSGTVWQNMSIFKEIKSENLGILDTTDLNSDGLSDAVYVLNYPSNGNRTKTKVYLNGVETRYYEFDETSCQAIAFIVKNTGLSNGAAIYIDYQTCNTLPTSHPVHALAIDSDPVDPVNDSIIYAALYGAGVYRSDDAGYTWNFKSSGLSNTDMLSLAIDPVTTTTLYAGTWGGGIFRTLNSADTWSSFNTGLTHTVVNTILVDPTVPTRIYAGTMLGGVFWYNSGGGTWVQAATNVNATDINNTYVKDIVIDTANGTLYAGTYTDSNAPVGGVFMSADSGATWARVTSLANNGIFCLAIDGAAGDDTLYAGTYKRFISKSTDSGTTWSVVNASSPDNLFYIFDTTKVLFSGYTYVTVTPIEASYQRYGRFSSLWNNESYEFIYTVSDLNGNPLTSGSSISVSVTSGTLAGDVSVTIPETQYGHTQYTVCWTNNINSGTENEPAELIVQVTSQANNSVTVKYPCFAIPPLTIDPTTETLDAGGGSISFTAWGGSDISANYVWTTTNGTFSGGAATQIGGYSATLITTAAEDGCKIMVTLYDTANGQLADAQITQASP